VLVIAIFTGARQPAGALVDLRLAVLGLLCLVQQEPGPAQLGVGHEVDAQQSVGRDGGIGARDEFAEALAEAAHGAGYRHHVQGRGEPRGLGGPVRHHAGWRDDQERCGRRVTLPGVADQSKGLQCLSGARSGESATW
jgi:hypothetical protein